MAEDEWAKAMKAWDALEAECDAQPHDTDTLQIPPLARRAEASSAEPQVGQAVPLAAVGVTDSARRRRKRPTGAVPLESAARRKSRASGVARARCGQTFASDSARLLATGPRAGCELRDDNGVPLRTVANHGLAQGARAQLAEGNATAKCHGFAVRALETATPLLSHQMVARALAELTGTGDMQRANKILHHDDVTTVRVVIALWFVEFKLPVPAAFAVDAEREEELSDDAKRRLRRRRGDLLEFRFIVESCGCYTSTMAPLVPPQWIGREFDSGADMRDALVETVDPGTDLPLLATYDLRLAEDAAWMDREALQRCVLARQVSPLAVVRLSYSASNGVVGVSFEKYKTKVLDPHGAVDKLFRVVTGCVLESTVAAAVVLEVPAELMTHLKQASTIPASEYIPSSVSKSREASFEAPSAAARYLLEPAAQLQMAIRRGRGLCTDSIVRKAVSDLLQTASHPVAELGYVQTSGTRMLLWRLLGCVFQDVCPYAEARDGLSYCSIQELVGLAALAHADHRFRLPPKVAQRVLATALRLHSYDGPGCVWPWRGWNELSKCAKPAMFEFSDDCNGGSELRNAIRAALATMPLASGDKAVLLRHLGALTDGSQWLHKLRPLCDSLSATSIYTVAEGALLDAETRLASLDHILRPNILLFVQACLPWIPQEESQHSLAALADLIWRLSSSINVRIVRQRNAGMSFDEELFRITSFVDKQVETEEIQAAKRMALEKYDPMRLDRASQTAKWPSALATMHLTPHEQLMAKVITSVQRHLSCGTAAARESPPRQTSSSLEHMVVVNEESSGGRGRPPTRFESRTSFLQLFGIRHDFSIPIPTDVNVAPSSTNGLVTVSATIAGTVDAPVLVQTVGADGRTCDVQQRDVSGLYDKAVDALVKHYEYGREMAPLPSCCPGFAWSCANRVIIKVRFITTGSRALEFLVDKHAIPPFDGSSLLVPANAPEEILITKRPRVHRLLKQVMYDPEATMEFVDDPMSLLTKVETEVSGLLLDRSHNAVVDWADLGTALPKAFWRDLFVKITCRENDTLTVSPVGRDGRRTGSAVQPMTEGTMLRVLIGLQLVYPFMLRRRGELRFKIVTEGKANAEAFTHLTRTVSLLAFGAVESAGTRKVGSRPVPRVTTKLWSHQVEACSRTFDGIQEGKRGFADASAVGAGKSLSSLAVICKIARFMEAQGIPRHGFLVLVPTVALIREWELQAHLHTTGLNVLVQAANGALVSRGSSAGSTAKVSNNQSRADQIDACTVVITTLSRARDKPFVGHKGWDFVVIDECLSVQNDTAVQTMEAWRQVAASKFGVLMLSATFFRSSFKRLFYMIRMLRSALPRTEPYLAALLREHITVFVPENRRTWSLLFQPVSLGDATFTQYRQLLTDGNAASREHRSLWTELRSFLRTHYDTSTVIAAFASEAARLMRSGRRPALFANSDEEAARIMAAIPGSHGLCDAAPDEAKTSWPLVLTVHRHSHGLNLQDRCDALVCRPHPGDIIEQMKGRIDRPGQTKNNLILSVLFASETIEEAEAANIKLCGAFFRQWLDPLSKKFQEISIEASFAAARKIPPGAASAPSARKTKPTGQVAAAFQIQLRGIMPAIPEQGTLTDQYHCTTTNDEDHSTSITAAAAAAAIGSKSQGIKFDGAQHGSNITPKVAPVAEPKDAGLFPFASTRVLSKCLKRTKSPKSRKQKTPGAARRAGERQQPASTSAGADAGESGAAKRPRSTKQEAKPPLVVVPTTADLAERQPVPRMDATTIRKAVLHLQKHDARLAGVIAAIGQPTGLLDQIGGASDCFKSLAKSIVYQQLSVKVAAVIFKRLVDLCGGDALLTPAGALNLSDDDLRHKCGFSYRKAGYLKHLAASFVSGELSDAGLSKMSDEEAMAALTKVRGLGEWSVHMFLMFSLGRQDVFPRGDLAIRKAMKRLYAMEDVEGHQTAVKELPPMVACNALAEVWSPYRTVGSWYMWHVVETKEAAYTF